MGKNKSKTHKGEVASKPVLDKAEFIKRLQAGRKKAQERFKMMTPGEQQIVQYERLKKRINKIKRIEPKIKKRVAKYRAKEARKRRKEKIRQNAINKATKKKQPIDSSSSESSDSSDSE